MALSNIEKLATLTNNEIKRIKELLDEITLWYNYVQNNVRI